MEMSSRLQPGELPAAAGATTRGEALESDDISGEADQDRGESHEPCESGHVPAGGGSGPARAVRGAPGSDRSAASAAEPRVIVRRGRMRMVWSRGGWGWSAVR